MCVCVCICRLIDRWIFLLSSITFKSLSIALQVMIMIYWQAQYQQTHLHLGYRHSHPIYHECSLLASTQSETILPPCMVHSSVACARREGLQISSLERHMQSLRDRPQHNNDLYCSSSTDLMQSSFFIQTYSFFVCFSVIYKLCD